MTMVYPSEYDENSLFWQGVIPGHPDPRKEFKKKQRHTRYNGVVSLAGSRCNGSQQIGNSGGMSKKRTRLVKLGRFVRWAGIALGLVVCVLVATDLYVSLSTEKFIYADTQSLPERPVALVLGTSRHYAGKMNPFYKARVEAAARLYAEKKVRAVVASGDNATRQYNEPRMLRKDLIAAGVPAELVTMDFAGFRTLDSIVRAKEVFKLDSFVVVSQRFQVERALYIARAHDIKAIGFVAENPPYFGWFWRVRLREVLARFLAVLDVTVLDTMPRFLGPKVDVSVGLPVLEIEIPGMSAGGKGEDAAAQADSASPATDDRKAEQQ